jgi:chromosome partitioning protein
MHIVSVINYKGGVGKTSVTGNLAAELAFRGFRVLMIDLDAQASLTFSFITPDVWNNEYAENKTIKSWFESYDTGNPMPLPDLIVSPPRVANWIGNNNKLDIIFSHLGLINVDLELATKLGGVNIGQAKRNFVAVHRRLADGLTELTDDDYDVVLIDCPPNFNIVTKTAIIASHHLLIPARPDYLSTLGIDYLIRSVNGLVKDYNDYADAPQGDPVARISPRILGVVFTMIQEYGGVPISAQRSFIAQVKRLSDVEVFESYIKRNDSIFAAAAEYGVPAVLRSYDSESHQSVVRGMEEVATEFCSMLGLRR